ncbi:sensor histidine kinase [Photobacterium ganghwense]|uniref:sensor histidine kinase n=1 Tax=Photobacterium ganghwense TaxID=320778 RepID=UPI001C2D899F|nr:sensor histidine kinase KdpD [Photobacterium ganghwense]MBV1840882.1 sensor histidine kinase KdpD [Photobacterium ganghwense]
MDENVRSQQADALLSKVIHEGKGKLTVFLGAAPGVGKTYAMLSAAKERLQQGTDLMVGLVETHGRAETEAMLAELEVLPRKQVNYHSTVLTEFDLDGALARKPTLILVDELAHTNVPGSRHKRRYQDVAELLAAGIDVYTTVNIQHLASLNDVVKQITGIRVRETVPDSFVDDAYDILFIDLPPLNLVERLQQGKVYLPEYARLAMDTFFSVSNLTALRELAMKRVIEQVDASLISELEARAEKTEYILKDKLLVLISANSDHRYLIRIGRQMAERRQIPWTVVWVDTGKTRDQKKRTWLNEAMAVAEELGATVEVLRGSSTYKSILPFLSEQWINTVLVGAGTRHRLFWWKKRLYQRLIESGLPVEVSVYRAPGQLAEPQEHDLPDSPLGDKKGHLFGLAYTAVATVLAVLLLDVLSRGNLVLLYVLAILGIGLKFGARPAMATAVWSFLSFNFFLTAPIYTLKVTNQDDVATLIFLICIGLISGPAASRIRHQFILLKESNRYAETLKELAQALSVADDEKALWKSISRHIGRALEVKCTIALTGDDRQKRFIPPPRFTLQQLDESVVDWTMQHGHMAGRFTDTLSASKVTVVPVVQENTVIAAVILYWDPAQTQFGNFERELLQAMLQQAAGTWRRIQLVTDLESARVKTEVEQIRSALLSSVSHDLKSPLSAMMGAAESLRILDKQLNNQDRYELLDTILQESRRLDSYIQNLLDMTKLGHGSLKIERDWVSVDDIIGSVLSRLKRYFPAVKIDYVRRHEPPLLYVHAALVEQALFNILENAVRFSPQSEPITIVMETTPERCRIAIEDKGPGIPKASQEQIFNMFYVVADGDQKKQNTGMGLAICRGMISAHGGKVRATDGSQGQGTRIEVELPLDYPERALGKVSS